MNHQRVQDGQAFLQTVERATGAIERQQWVDRVSQGLAAGVGRLLQRPGPAGRRVKNFLHGSWLGHPLHPVLTDLPVGAWTASAILDVCDMLTPRRVQGYGKSADSAMRIGVAGAAAAALAGIVDWYYLRGPVQRIGTSHALLNSGALLTYLRSLSLRRAGRRGAGRFVGALGYSMVLCSAYLGGRLVYRHGIGTDHADRGSEPRDFVPVLDENELSEDRPRRVLAGDVRVLLVRSEGEIHALGEVCSHQGGPLAEGRLEDGGIVCPWHGSRFCLEDGVVLDGPASAPQPRFETRVRNGRIEVRRHRSEVGAPGAR